LVVLNESREPNLRLLERASSGNPGAFRKAYGRAVNRNPVSLETGEAPGEPIPPGIVNQTQLTADRREPEVGVVDAQEQTMLGS
jgi:hypothetical protein